MTTLVEPDQWQGMYDQGYQGLLVDSAYSHPAKAARALVARIYAHAFQQGWLKPGGVVLDPFGGVACCALPACTQGVRFIGIELEERFHALALENFDLWRRKFAHRQGWVAPVMLQGDSRRLVELVQGAGLVVSSPPYSESRIADANNVQSEKCPNSRPARSLDANRTYGSTEGQLSALPSGSIDAVLSSPPYAESIGKGSNQPGMKVQTRKNGEPMNYGASQTQIKTEAYGSTPGQLGAMPPGSIDAVLSSPPYADQKLVAAGHTTCQFPVNGSAAGSPQVPYGSTPGQLGSESSTTFWAAAKEIVAACHHVLAPHGHALWIVKPYVSKGKLVDFPGQWQALCESVGFRTCCVHHAMLTRTWEEHDLFAGVVQKEKKRASFFRRLAEKKGSPRIDYEVVLCMEKVS